MLNGKDHKKIILALIDALSEKKYSACVRTHALEILSNSREPIVIEKIREKLNDPYRMVRSYAIRALGEFEDTDKNTIDSITAIGKNKKEFFGVMAESIEALKKISKKFINEGDPDKVGKKLIDEVIPEINQVAYKKKMEDPRYGKRVGRENIDAIDEFKKLKENIDKNLDEINNKFSKNLTKEQINDLKSTKIKLESILL
jgi:hypothetical protein